MEIKRLYIVQYNGQVLLRIYAHSIWEAAEKASFLFPNLDKNKFITKLKK